MGSAETEALRALGWSERWDALFAPFAAEERFPGRVIRADRGSALVASANGVVRAEPSAALRKGAVTGEDLPATGDWVALAHPAGHETAIVEAVLPRASAFMRGSPGKATAVQVLAANVDTVLVVHGLDREINPRRIERELAMTWESGAIPVVVLTKADVAVGDPDEARAVVESVALGADVVVASAVRGEGLEALVAFAGPGRTVALIGPSGAGKSTLINAMLGEERQATREVRVSDGKGRHTTTARELIGLPGGGILVDTPGMRELAVWELSEGLNVAFADIAALAEGCRFRDCTHEGEPGCAVRKAVDEGDLPATRLESWHKLSREAEALARRHDVLKRMEHKKYMRELSKTIKSLHKHKPGE